MYLRFTPLYLAVTAFLFLSAAQAQHPNPRFPVTPNSPLPKQHGNKPTTGNAALPAAPSLNASSWTLIGPAPITAGQSYSGRVAGIAADPAVTNTLYIAAAGGGVWKTTDGGTTWTPLTDTQTDLAMGAIAVAPSNSSVIYAGTGEANNSADSQYGAGILVSTNGGTTWSLSTGPSGIFATGLTTSKIAVDPTNPNIAYAAMANIGNNRAFITGTGIYRTADGGATWTNLTSAVGLTTADPWSDVVVDPASPTTLYAAVGTFYSTTNAGVYKSTNSGTTWTKLTTFADGASNTDVGRIALAIAPSAHLTVFASVASVSTGATLAVQKTTDGGTTVGSVTPPNNYMGGQGWYDQWIIVDPANANNVYVAGSAGSFSIQRSTNGGTTWADISTGGASPHADHHAVTFDASAALVEGDDGGVFRLASPATATTWTDLNGNLATIQFQGIAQKPDDAAIAAGGSQDNGTEVMTNGSPIWTETDGGDGGFVRFNRQTTTDLLRVSPVASFGASAFFRKSTNTGASWSNATTGLNGADSMNFYPPFAIDPTNGNHAYFGSFRIYETTNFASSWSLLGTTGLQTTDVDAIAPAPSDPTNTIYVAQGGYFASNSDFAVTTNHGSSWTNHNLPANSGRISSIAVDPTTSTTVYVVTSTFNSAGHVWKSTTGGASWTQIGTPAAGLPDLPTWAVAIDPLNGNLYVGNDIGVYQSTNGGTSWTRFGTGLPNAQVLDLDLESGLRILMAGTHGRSAWEIALAASNVTSQFSVTEGAVLFNRSLGLYTQNVTITNNGSALSNVAYVLDNLSAGWTLTNGDGTTAATSPTGSPYKVVGSVGAGASATFQLQFSRTGSTALTYTARILDGTPR